MLVVVVPFTCVADGILVSIYVGSFILSFYVVITSNLVPVIVVILRPGCLVCVLVIVVPFANVTHTVVVLVFVLFLVFRLYITIAYSFKIVILVIVGIFFIVFMLTEDVIAGGSIAFSVVILVFVITFDFSAA